MRSESLNSRVMIQRPDTTQDAAGQPIDDWVDVAPAWASIRHPSGLSAIKADASVSIVKASIRIRYRTGLDASMRVKHKATLYDIKAILPDEAGKEYLDLVCETVS
jgi:SPP1 family predicted phage head-tail adaptor